MRDSDIHPLAKMRDHDRGHGHGSFLPYAFDAGFLSCAHPPDRPCAIEEEEEEASTRKPDSERTRSDSESNRWDDLATGLRMFSESILKMELAELEMVKTRETQWAESEKKRAESETQRTEMMMKTQLQIAEFISKRSPSRKRKRKRKRVENNGSSSSSSSSSSSFLGDDESTERWGFLMLGMLQCNLSF